MLCLPWKDWRDLPGVFGQILPSGVLQGITTILWANTEQLFLVWHMWLSAKWHIFQLWGKASLWKRFPGNYHKCWFIITNLILKAAQVECNVCGDKILGTYFTIDDKVFCEEDYKVNSGKICILLVTNILEKSWEMSEMWRGSRRSDYKDLSRSVPPQLFQLCGEIDCMEKWPACLTIVIGLPKESSWCSLQCRCFQPDLLPGWFPKV